MYFVRIIDVNGLFVEDAFVDEITELTIEIPVTEPFYHPKWDGEKWTEGGQPPEPVPQPPTTEDRLQAIEDTLLFITLGGM